MKNLKQFILESSNILNNILENIKIDFQETKSISDKKKRAKEQEKLFINALQEASDKYTVKSIEEWCKENNKTYSPELDSKNGDIVIEYNNKEYFIDLKVSNKVGYLVGTPSILSLVNFSGQDNHIYFLCDLSCTNKYIVDPDKLMKVMLSKDKNAYLMTSFDRVDNPTKPFKEVTDMIDKVNIQPQKDQTNPKMNDTSVLYNEDYVSTKTIKDNYKEIKYNF